MTCVVTLAIVADGRLTIGHVGDSRLYKIRPDGLQKLTHDHSPVGEREDAQELSELDGDAASAPPRGLPRRRRRAARQGRRRLRRGHRTAARAGRRHPPLHRRPDRHGAVDDHRSAGAPARRQIRMPSSTRSWRRPTRPADATTSRSSTPKAPTSRERRADAPRTARRCAAASTPVRRHRAAEVSVPRTMPERSPARWRVEPRRPQPDHLVRGRRDRRRRCRAAARLADRGNRDRSAANHHRQRESLSGRTRARGGAPDGASRRRDATRAGHLCRAADAARRRQPDGARARQRHLRAAGRVGRLVDGHRHGDGDLGGRIAGIRIESTAELPIDVGIQVGGQGARSSCSRSPDRCARRSS